MYASVSDFDNHGCALRVSVCASCEVMRVYLCVSVVTRLHTNSSSLPHNTILLQGATATTSTLLETAGPITCDPLNLKKAIGDLPVDGRPMLFD